jgi:hypothetical protein
MTVDSLDLVQDCAAVRIKNHKSDITNQISGIYA